jgi:hypothetical protein
MIFTMCIYFKWAINGVCSRKKIRAPVSTFNSNKKFRRLEEHLISRKAQPFGRSKMLLINFVSVAEF